MVLDWRLGLLPVSLLPLTFLLQMTVKTLWSKSFQHFMECTQKMSEDRDTNAMQSDVRFEHVTFAYPNKKDSVLSDVSPQYISGESVSLVFTAWMLGGLLVLKTISNAIADMSKHFFSLDLVGRVSEKIILKLKKFSLGFYTNERLGEISTIIHKDVDNMEMVVGHLWTRMSADFIVALILGIGLFCVDWRMGLAMFAFLPVALFFFYRGIRSGMKAQQET